MKKGKRKGGLLAFGLVLFFMMLVPSSCGVLASSAEDDDTCTVSSVGVGPDGWTAPAVGKVSSPYGGRVSPTAGASSDHHGTDIDAGYDAPIYAAADGTVTIAGTQPSLSAQCPPVGYVRIDHGGGIVTNYLHMETAKIKVKEGQTVKAGEQIAQVGGTGCVTGPHLHFEVMINGSWTDPEPFMKDRGITLGDPLLSNRGKISTVDEDVQEATSMTPLQWAYTQEGKKYDSPGDSVNTFDCSGLVQTAFQKTLGIALPRTAAAQKNNAESYGGEYVTWDDESDLLPGDLLFYPDGSHVVFYAGNGKIFHAPQPGGHVEESTFNPNKYDKKAVRVAGATSASGFGACGSTGEIDTTEADENGDANTPEGAKAYARALLPKWGWDDDTQYQCLVNLWEHESQWDYKAANPNSAARGIPQAMWDQHPETNTDAWRNDGKAQIKWGLNYIKGRYQTPCKAWAHWQNPPNFAAWGHWY